MNNSHFAILDGFGESPLVRKDRGEFHFVGRQYFQRFIVVGSQRLACCFFCFAQLLIHLIEV